MLIRYKVKILNPFTMEVQKIEHRTLEIDDPRLNITNDNPNLMFYRFLHKMVQLKVGVHELTDAQFEYTQKNIDWLSEYHPQYVYTLKADKRWVIKKERQAEALIGTLADLEDRFIKDRKIPNRAEIRSTLDLAKRGFMQHDEAIEIINKLIN